MRCANQQPAAAMKWNAPFPVSPSGGKAGVGGFPPRRGTLRASKQRWHVALLPAPPTRGLPPPCASPASALSDKRSVRKSRDIDFAKTELFS